MTVYYRGRGNTRDGLEHQTPHPSTLLCACLSPKAFFYSCFLSSPFISLHLSICVSVSLTHFFSYVFPLPYTFSVFPSSLSIYLSVSTADSLSLTHARESEYRLKSLRGTLGRCCLWSTTLMPTHASIFLPFSLTCYLLLSPRKTVVCDLIGYFS